MDLRSLRKHLHFLMVFRIPILCSYVVLVMKRRNGYGKSCLPEASVCFFLFFLLTTEFFVFFRLYFSSFPYLSFGNAKRYKIVCMFSARKKENIGFCVAFYHSCVIQPNPCYKHKCVSPVMQININVSVVHFAIKYH